MRLIDADKLKYDDIECVNGKTYMVVHAPEIDDAPTVKAITLDKVKQAREEIHDLKKSDCPFNCGHNAIELAEEILDKLIAESEEK